MSVMPAQNKATATVNITFVRPATFYITGFTGVPHVEFYYVFLCFLYIVTVVGNVFLITVICLVKILHTPKYMIVFNLALTDLCGSTALVPKLLDMFLFHRQHVVYEACLSYMFFVLCFSSMQSYTLLIMAYDRFVAICFPLRYHSIVTKTSIGAMLLFTWVLVLSLITSVVKLIDQLSFCGSVAVKSFYCDHGPIYRLSCNDNSLNYAMAYVGFIMVMCLPFILIVVTYVCILAALIRISTREEQRRALKTCLAHLILVAVFYLPFFGTNIAAVTSYIQQNVRIINSTLTHMVPALLNPIIYSLKTEEVLRGIKTLWNREKLHTQTIKQ